MKRIGHRHALSRLCTVIYNTISTKFRDNPSRLKIFRPRNCKMES